MVQVRSFSLGVCRVTTRPILPFRTADTVVGVREVQPDGLVDAEPLDPVMLLGSRVDRLSLPRTHDPQREVEIGVRHPQVGNLGQDVHMHRDAEFLTDLSLERAERGLARFDVATWKVPDCRGDLMHQRKVGR